MLGTNYYSHKEVDSLHSQIIMLTWHFISLCALIGAGLRRSLPGISTLHHPPLRRSSSEGGEVSHTFSSFRSWCASEGVYSWNDAAKVGTLCR